MTLHLSSPVTLNIPFLAELLQGLNERTLPGLYKVFMGPEEMQTNSYTVWTYYSSIFKGT